MIWGLTEDESYGNKCIPTLCYAFIPCQLYDGRWIWLENYLTTKHFVVLNPKWLPTQEDPRVKSQIEMGQQWKAYFEGKLK